MPNPEGTSIRIPAEYVKRLTECTMPALFGNVTRQVLSVIDVAWADWDRAQRTDRAERVEGRKDGR